MNIEYRTRNIYYLIFLFFCLLPSSVLHAQQSKRDSLLLLLKKDKPDTGKVTHLYQLSNQYRTIGSYDSALYYANTALSLAARLVDGQEGVALSYNIIGVICLSKGDYIKALDCLMKALSICEQLEQNGNPALKIRYSMLKSKILSNFGSFYYKKLDYQKAVDYYLKALKLNEELGDKKTTARVVINIANVYNAQASQLNVDSVIHKKELNKKALDSYIKALKMCEEFNLNEGVAMCLGNIGTLYDNQKDFTNALEYYFKALKLFEGLGDKYGITVNLSNIGLLYTKIGKFKEAEKYLLNSIILSGSIGAKGNLRIIEEGISDLYETTGQHKLALIHYKRAMTLKDTLFNEENEKKMARREMDFEFEKKEAVARAEQDKKDAVSAAESRKQKTVIWSVTGSLLLVLFFAVFIFHSLRITRKQKQVIEIKSRETELQNKIIEEQKKIVENKNMNITDSITYAKRIQEVFVLGEQEINTMLSYESFVFYRPKDIVSGDFYWISTVKDNGNPLYVVAVADCTGHGVPGAFLSMMGSMLLNEIVNKKQVSDPALILKEIHYGILASFLRNNDLNNSQDGMDMAVCVMDPANKVIRYAGAKNPLYVVHPKVGSEEAYLEVVKPTMFSLGGKIRGDMLSEVEFTNHEMPLAEGMCIYLFSDGYKDQFNAKQKLRFGSRQFINTLTGFTHLPMQAQKNMLIEIFDDWKGSYEQIDDVLVMGIKV